MRRAGFAARPPVYALGTYRGRARRGLLAYKEVGRRHLAVPFGQHLALGFCTAAAAHGWGQRWCVVPVPSRRVAARRRGGSHVLRLAIRMARGLRGHGWSVRTADCLALAPGVLDSAGLGHAARAANVRGRVRVRCARLPPVGTPVVLVDDVLTTGSTLDACVRALRGAGRDVWLVVTLTAT